MNKAQEFRAAFRANAVFRSADWLGRCFWSHPKFLGAYVFGAEVGPEQQQSSASEAAGHQRCAEALAQSLSPVSSKPFCIRKSAERGKAWQVL